MWRFLSIGFLLTLLFSPEIFAFDEKAALTESQAAIGRALRDHRFIDSEGKEVGLADLRGKPLVVEFVYTGCIQVCPTTTRFLAAAVKDAERSLGPGTFRVATIGFNQPFDSPAAMKAFARKYGLGSPDWLFLSPRGDVAELAADFGFRYEPTPAGFDHLLQVSIVDARGRLYRQVYGEELAAPLFVGPLLELLKDAPVEQSSLAVAWGKLKILCTVYDPSAGRYRVSYAVLIEILVGTSVMLGGLGFLAREWRARRTRSG